MPYELHWDDDDHTILRVDIYGQSTWEQHHETATRIVETMQKVSHRVDVIINDMGGMPPGNPMSHFRATFSKFGAMLNLGLVVVVNHPSFLIAVVNLLLRLYRVYNHHNGGFVDSLDAARQLIAKDRGRAAVS